MSPQMTTVCPSILPLCARMVEASSSAWVGCSCWPSPPLTTAALMYLVSSSAEPACAWRITTMSGAIASRLVAVSMRVSPLVVEDADAVKLMPSADRRLAAISNEVRVRVEASRKRLMTVLPRRVGTFLIGRSAISRKRSPRSRRVLISSAVRCSMPSRCFCENACGPFISRSFPAVPRDPGRRVH